MQNEISIFFDKKKNLFYITGRGFAVVTKPENIIKEIKKLRYIYPEIDQMIEKVRKAH